MSSALETVDQQSPTKPAGFQPHPSVFFTSNNGLNDSINVEAACLGQVSQLDRASEPCIIGDKRRVSVIVHWPGMSEWKFLNMAVCRFDANGTPRTYTEVLSALAVIIKTFYDEMTSESAVPSTNPTWDLRNIPFNALYVSELKQVSTGKWQPVIKVPRAPSS